MNQKDVALVCTFLRSTWHHKDGRCSYDDFGTGSSGMAPKPCSKYRKKDPAHYWCRECQESPVVARIEAELKVTEA